MELPVNLVKLASEVSEVTYRRIEEVVSGSPKYLYDAAMHLIRAGGKRLRPLVVALTAKMYGMPIELSSWAAASVEILHNFTLIHDDIIDRDEFRRGVPTVHKVWGEGIAIVAGDLLFAKSYEAMLRLMDYGISYERVLRALKELTWAAVTVAEGQAMDIEFSRKESVTVEEYLEMVRRKTAALFKSSAVLGALVAGADERDVLKIADFATSIGIAFQIRDDELGLVADEKVLGKPKYSDLREGKRTILVIYSLSVASDDQRKHILSVLGSGTATYSDLERVAKIIVELGALDFSNKVAEEFIKRGISSLEGTNPLDAEAREMLKTLANYLTRRVY